MLSHSYINVDGIKCDCLDFECKCGECPELEKCPNDHTTVKGVTVDGCCETVICIPPPPHCMDWMNKPREQGDTWFDPTVKPALPETCVECSCKEGGEVDC